MRIVIATGLYPPDFGGPATYSKLLYDELPKRDVEVDVVAFGSVRTYPNVLRQIIFWLMILWRARKADMIYAQDTVSVGWPSFFANLFLRKKFVVKVVGDYVWEQGVQRFGVTEMLDDFPVSVKKYGLWLSFLRMLQLLVVRHADMIITPSEYLKRIVLKWDVSDEKVHVIYNSFDQVQSIESLSISGTPSLISVGRLVPWKGFKVLIDTVIRLRTSFTDFKNLELSIIGDGPDREALERYIAQHSCEDYVHLLGRMSHDAVLRHMAGADVFVLNTGYEGLPHIVLEAFAVGTPVVTTHVGGNGEVITSGENGFLVPYNDSDALYTALIHILSDTDIQKGFSTKGKETLTRFSKERMLTKTIETLKKACI